jgi:O-antigen/teichoic acid export membrane protein
MILVWAFASEFLQVVYGYQFDEAKNALRILVLANPFMFLGSIWGTALIVLNRQRRLIIAAAGAVLVSLTLNWTLILSFGYLGASWATVLTDAYIALVSYMLLPSWLRDFSFKRVLSKPILASLAMGGSIILFGSFHWLLNAFLALSIYAGSIVLLRGIPSEDWRPLVQSLKRSLFASSEITG